MSSYILSVCGAVIISALVSIIMPEGKTGKFINGIVKITCVLIMVSPIISWVYKLKGEKSQSVNNIKVDIDDDFLNYFNNVKAEELEKEIKKIIENQYDIEVFVEIDWQISNYAFTLKKVLINIKNFGIYKKDEHIIIIEQIQTIVSDKLKIDKDVVVINE